MKKKEINKYISLHDQIYMKNNTYSVFLLYFLERDQE